MQNIIKHRWYPLITSEKIKNNNIITTKTFFGKDLIIYRQNKKIVVKDRWCPHRGADMSKGVINHDCIACPYHGWRFRHSDGKLIDMPSENNTAACDLFNLIHSIF